MYITPVCVCVCACSMERVYVHTPVCVCVCARACLCVQLDTAHPSTSNHPLKDTIHIFNLTWAWNQALRRGRLPCLKALICSCLNVLENDIRTSLVKLAKLGKPADLFYLHVILQQFDNEQRAQIASMDDVLLAANQHGARM